MDIVGTITSVTRKTTGYGESLRTVGITVEARFEFADYSDAHISIDLPAGMARKFFVGDEFRLVLDT